MSSSAQLSKDGAVKRGHWQSELGKSKNNPHAATMPVHKKTVGIKLASWWLVVGCTSRLVGMRLVNL
jgi:hypothetical protein